MNQTQHAVEVFPLYLFVLCYFLVSLFPFNFQTLNDQVYLTCVRLSSNQKIQLAYIPIIFVQISAESQNRLCRDLVDLNVGLLLNVTRVSLENPQPHAAPYMYL